MSGGGGFDPNAFWSLLSGLNGAADKGKPLLDATKDMGGGGLPLSGGLLGLLGGLSKQDMQPAMPPPIPPIAAPTSMAVHGNTNMSSPNWLDVWQAARQEKQTNQMPFGRMFGGY